MDTIYSRANQLFAFSTSTLFCLAGLCWISGQFLMPAGQPSVIFEPKDMILSTGYEARGIRVESNRLDMRYALRVDVSELFNWSVKEVFVMLVAEYSTPKNSKNQVIVWDRIIMRDEPEKHVIAIKNGKPKYQFWDDGKHLKGHENVTFALHWNTVTNAGTLPVRSAPGQIIKVPSEISSGKTRQ